MIELTRVVLLPFSRDKFYSAESTRGIFQGYGIVFRKSVLNSHALLRRLTLRPLCLLSPSAKRICFHVVNHSFPNRRTANLWSSPYTFPSQRTARFMQPGCARLQSYIYTYIYISRFQWNMERIMIQGVSDRFQLKNCSSN